MIGIARELGSRQNIDGSFPSDLDDTEHKADPCIATSFSLMFLAKGRRPVVMAYLKSADAAAPDFRRDSLFNLMGFLERSWGLELTYQELDLATASVEDLLETPVLMLGAREAPTYTAEEKKKLRGYVDRGGFIFASPSCLDGDFDQGFRALMAEIFPEPDAKLRLLPADHSAWHAEAPVDPAYKHELWGIDTGCRTCVIYCPQDLACYWSLARVGRESSYSDVIRDRITTARIIGLNVLAYATNRQVAAKNPQAQAPQLVESKGERERGKLYLARLIHPGRCTATAAATSNLLRAAGAEFGIGAGAESREVRPTDAELFDYHLIIMNGRTSFQFTAEERAGLRTYLERGGMLFVDSVCSSEAFTASFRRELKAILPESELSRIPTEHPLFTTKFGGVDLSSVSYREMSSEKTATPMKAIIRAGEPQLEGIRFGDRYAVVFSPYDISCSLSAIEPLSCVGYVRADAVRIAINVLLYSLRN